MSAKLENKAVATSISKLYLQSKLADVHFAFTTNGESIKVPAHKTILAAASPVFEAMFFGQLKENDVVEIVDSDASEFEEFLQLFYLPTVTITMENIDAVVRLADKYDMMECLKASVTFPEKQLSKDYVICWLNLAILLNNQPLKQSCENEMKKFTQEIIKSETFLHCDQSVLEYILKSEYLNCKEIDLFRSCVEWAKSSCQANGLDGNDPTNWRNQLGDSFHLIRFETMTNTEKTKRIL